MDFKEIPESAMADEEKDGGPTYLGELGTLNDENRLVIPADLRQFIPWLKSKKPIRLIAELKEKGRIRLYPSEQVTVRLAEVRRRILEGHPKQREVLAAFGDRFRKVSYYPSDTRVHLSPAITAFLKREAEPNETFYIEGCGEHIEVMTLAIREERLKAFMADLELPAL